jgi:hypothetical protein
MLCALIFLSSLTFARADIQASKQRNIPREQARRDLPPSGVSQSVQVQQGGRVDIILEAHGYEGKTVSFLPRDTPAHGALTGFRQLTRNTAAVTYSQDPGDEASDRDSFTFSVQVRDSMVSAPATVDIAIVPLPSRVVASPAELDFGTLNVGEVSRAQITLENRGGGVAVGQLYPPSPWSVDGSADYRLGKNERQTFQLIFRPGGGRVFEEEIILGRGSDQRTRLFGTGIETFPVIAKAAPEPTIVVDKDPPKPVPLPPRRETTPNVTATEPPPSASVSTKANSAPFDQSTNPGFAVLNDVSVDQISLRWNDSRNLQIGWVTPQPAPKAYRVELRYLSMVDGKLKVEWRPHARVEIQTGQLETTATLRGLPWQARQTLRVTAIDARGYASVPSPLLQVDMPPGFQWPRPRLLHLLFLGLAVCVFLIWRRRRLEREAAEVIEEAHQATLQRSVQRFPSYSTR